MLNTTRLSFESTEVAGRRLLTEPLIWSPRAGSTITVPAGFYTDFASTPRFLHPVWPPTGDYENAAVIHDHAYYAGAGTRKEADKMFLAVMVWLNKQDGYDISWFTRWALYRGVRAGGWVAWNNYRDQE